MLDKFEKLFFKLDNHHHRRCHRTRSDDELSSSSSLHVFQSHVSNLIDQLALDLKAGSEIMISLSWFQKCFGLLPKINKAFAKLVIDIDYPMSKSDINVDSIEGYLNYTMNLLDLLNSISSSLSHLGQTRLSLAHGLNLILMEKYSTLDGKKYLKAIQTKGCTCFSTTNFGKHFHTQEKKDHNKAKILSAKESVVREAVKEMKSIGFWVCGVFLSCINSDGKPYMEMRKIVGGFESSLVATLDFKISELFINKMPSFSEIKEINNVVADLVACDDEIIRHDAAKGLKTKLCEFEKLFDNMSKEVDDLFGGVMTHRTQLIDG